MYRDKLAKLAALHKRSMAKMIEVWIDDKLREESAPQVVSPLDGWSLKGKGYKEDGK